MKHLLIATIVILTLIGCGSAEERKAAYLEKARLYLEEGDYDKARVELQNVLQIDPKDARAYYQIGYIHEGKQDFIKAYGNYHRASELDPENSEYLAKLGTFHLILTSNIVEATDYMERILKKDSHDIYGLVLKAGIMLKQGKHNEAKTLTKKIYSKYPDNLENALFIAAIYKKDDELIEAIKVLDSAYKLYPTNNRLAGTYVKTLFLNKDYDRAEKLLKDMLASAPESFEHYINLAGFYQKLNQFDKAEQILNDAIQADPKSSERQIAYVRFFKQTEGNEKAISVLKDLIKKYPDMGELRLAIAQIYVEENNQEMATSTYKDAINDFYDQDTGIKSRMLLASYYINKKDIDSAMELIDKTLEIEPNNEEANLLKAKIATDNQNYQQAIVSLRTVVKDAPQNITAYFMLAKAHKLNDEDEQAADVIQKAYENNRTDLRAVFALAEYYLINDDAIQAERLIDSYLAINSDNYKALSMKGKILLDAGKYALAKDYLNKLLLLHPEKENGYLFTAAALIEENKNSEAIAILEEGYLKTNYNRSILAALTTTQMSAKEYDAAVKTIKSEIARGGENAGLYLALASIYQEAGKYDEAEENFLRVIGIKPDNDKAYVLLSKHYVQRNEKEKALQILKDGQMKVSNDYAISISKAGVLEKYRDFEAAINAYEEILKKHGNKVAAINNLAILLSEYRTDAASKNRARELVDIIKDVNQPIILDTVGWVYYNTGNYTGAISALKTVVINEPENPVYNYHLGMAYYKIDNKASAKKYLTKALRNDVDFIGRSEAEKLIKTL